MRTKICTWCNLPILGDTRSLQALLYHRECFQSFEDWWRRAALKMAIVREEANNART